MRINFPKSVVFRYFVSTYFHISTYIRLTIEYNAFYEFIDIGSRNKLPHKKATLLFYFYIFEKEGLKTHFKHTGPICIQTY